MLVSFSDGFSNYCEWGVNIMWTKIVDKFPIDSKRRYYMAFSPQYEGYIFKCCFFRGYFCAIALGEILHGVTHYRFAKRSEYDRQLSNIEISDFD